jgi:hypothetical protein
MKSPLILGINPFQFIIENDKVNFEDYMYIRGKHFLKRQTNEEENDSYSSKQTPASWFSQCLDHFDKSNDNIPNRISLNATCFHTKRWKQVLKLT